MKVFCLLVFNFFSTLIFSAAIYAQVDSLHIPKPTGVYSVGTTHFEWSYFYSEKDSIERIIPVKFWYPAQDDTVNPVDKYSIVSFYNHVTPNSKVNSKFNHSIDRAPLIIIAPGRSELITAYTSLAEEWASRGYLVLSIGFPEISLNIYDNRTVLYSSDRFRPSPELLQGPYEKVDEFFEDAVDLATSDLDFIFKKLKKLDSENKNLLSGRIDYSRTGIFGHSLGGRIAGRFAARNTNIKAYLTMEALPPAKERKGGMDVPLAFMYSSSAHPGADTNYRTAIPNRKNDVYLIKMDGFGHNSVSDYTIITPAEFDYDINPFEGMSILRNLTSSFFDFYLKNTPRSPEFSFKNKLIHIESYLAN